MNNRLVLIVIVSATIAVCATVIIQAFAGWVEIPERLGEIGDIVTAIAALLAVLFGGSSVNEWSSRKRRERQARVASEALATANGALRLANEIYDASNPAPSGTLGSDPRVHTMTRETLFPFKKHISHYVEQLKSEQARLELAQANVEVFLAASSTAASAFKSFTTTFSSLVDKAITVKMEAALNYQELTSLATDDLRKHHEAVVSSLKDFALYQ